MLAEQRTNLLEMWLAVHRNRGVDIDPLVEHLVILLWVSLSLLFLPTPDCSQQMAMLGADSPSGGVWNESCPTFGGYPRLFMPAMRAAELGLNPTPPFSAIFFFFFWSHYSACGIFLPQPETEPWPMAMKHQVLTTGPPGEFLVLMNQSIEPLRAYCICLKIKVFRKYWEFEE